jgi:hypothetical protein
MRADAAYIDSMRAQPRWGVAAGARSSLLAEVRASATPAPARIVVLQAGLGTCLRAALLLAAALCTGPTVHAQADSAAHGLLDGQHFTGTVGAEGKDAPYNADSIVFSEGHFVSTDCIQYGFTRAPYSAERVGDGVRFRAVTTSPSHGQMTWEGTVRGDEAEATYRWVRERWFWTQRGTYWFKGRSRPPEPH